MHVDVFGVVRSGLLQELLVLFLLKNSLMTIVSQQHSGWKGEDREGESERGKRREEEEGTQEGRDLAGNWGEKKTGGGVKCMLHVGIFEVDM